MEIGELEAAVLAQLRGQGERTARDVFRALYKGRDIAYTTVSTTLERLVRKALLRRRAEKVSGRRVYLYVMREEEGVAGRVVRATMERLTKAFGPSAVSAVLEGLDRIEEEGRPPGRRGRRRS